MTSPAEGMAAAPTAARVAVNATTTVPASPNDTPCACQGHLASSVLSMQISLVVVTSILDVATPSVLTMV